jgi:CrcB protein
MTWIAVAVGGALGSALRHWVNMEIAHRFGNPVPHATVLVNVIGCVVIGALAGRIAGGHLHMTAAMRTFVFVGVLGGFTTFSSFGLDTFTLVQGGDHVAAFWNIVVQVGVGLAGVWLGFSLAL